MSKNVKPLAIIFLILVLITGLLVGYTLMNQGPRAQVSVAATTATNSPAAAPSLAPTVTALPSEKGTPTSVSAPASVGTASVQPIRAAFYNASYPDAWAQKGINPYTNYTPTLGNYNSLDPRVISQHIAAMQYGNVSAGIVTWTGQGTQSDESVATLLEAAAGKKFYWAAYYEPSGSAAPTAAQVGEDLKYLKDHYGTDPAYLQINGRPVVFASSKATGSCQAADGWKQANSTVGAYVVLKVFTGYRTCASQPDGWYQYLSSTSAEDGQKGYSYTISPGNWKAGDTPKLPRDINRWYTSVRNMVASQAPFQLILSFNGWDDGTAVESAKEWETGSGYGAFLDALHTNGEGTPPGLVFSTTPPARTTVNPTPKIVGKAQPTPTPLIQLPQLPVLPLPQLPTFKGDPVIGAAGDIACDPASPYWSLTGAGKNASACREKQTSDILMSLKQAGQLSVVANLGDDAYENGSYDNYVTSYGPTWGRLKDLTRPAVGNHEYLTKGATGYYQYFGAAAGDPKKGYYSYDLGSWHIIVVNSNCSEVGGCSAGSPQETWLAADLSQHAGQCTLAYWHHPRYSSGEHGNFVSMQTIWEDLSKYGTAIVLNGHSHDYERFAPQDATGKADPNGIREFVVGTGGKNHTGLTELQPNSEVFNDKTYGILKLTLHSNSYDWQFIPETGKTFTDSGTGTCQPRHP